MQVLYLLMRSKCLIQCLLVDTCPQCQSIWCWDDLKNDWQCKCGWNFSEAPISKLEQEDDDLSRLVAHSCGLVEGESIEIEIQSPLADLSLSQISLLMMSTALSLNDSSRAILRHAQAARSVTLRYLRANGWWARGHREFEQDHRWTPYRRR